MRYLLLALCFYLPAVAVGETARFSGGTCASQANWIQTALEQSTVVVNALNVLKDDPNCQALIKVLENTPEIKPISNEGFKKQAEAEGRSFAGFYRELQAVNEFLQPPPTRAVVAGKKYEFGSDSNEIIRYLLFRKSLDAVSQVQAKEKLSGMSDTQKAYYDNMSSNLRSFIQNAKDTADMTTNTTRAILSALPQSETCFQNRPSETLSIFTALVNSGAALATGGEFTQLGPFVASILKFNREMTFMNSIAGVEYERYKTSVACLVESTQEAYCGLKDAQDSLDFFKGTTAARAEASLDPAENPMGGMIVLLRDLPVISGWFQKVLFGIDPKLKVEAEMKNSNWTAVLTFIKQLNSLPATFRDLRQVYMESTQGASVEEKQAQVKTMLTELTQIFISGSGGYSANKDIDFFEQAINPDLVPFYLVGNDTFPNDFNPQMKKFDAFFSEWSRTGEMGFKDPDKLVDKIETRMGEIMEKANIKASNYFSQRMVVDPQNLITEGMVGPNVSPYKAIGNVRTYFVALIKKLKKSKEELEAKGGSAPEIDAINATVVMLDDTILRMDKILSGMKNVSQLAASDSVSSNRLAAGKAMDVIYEFANMLISRDSLIGLRTATAVKMDFADTIRRRESMSQAQEELLLSMGKDIIARLSRYFSDDPVVQRLDVSQATPIAEANLKATEQIFAPVLKRSIEELNCKLKGGAVCYGLKAKYGYNVGEKSFWKGLFEQMTFQTALKYFQKPTSDSASDETILAKLCTQTLAFESRKNFYELCKGTSLVSEFRAKDGSDALNLKYDDAYHKVEQILAGGGKTRLTDAKQAGVCAFRTYLRKNHIYRMYWSYQEQ